MSVGVGGEGTIFPVILRTDPPTVMTREQVDEYFRERGTVVRVTHIPATHPRSEHTSPDDFPIPENHHRMRIKGKR
jgi:hypothetical protein